LLRKIMYLGFYDLREEPFGSTPDPRFLFASATHREAVASLQCCIETGRGFFALIAPPGMGKTTILFKALEQYQNSASTAFLFNTQCNSREFIRFLLSEVGIEDETDDIVRMQRRFNAFLIANSRLGKRFILIVDEAQNLSDEVLETIRLLSNFETPRAKLMQIILAGQPELDATLKQPNLSQLLQRISLTCRIEPLNTKATGEYINHRLAVAGSRGEAIFGDEVIEVIATHSHGIPRVINSICFNALMLGYAAQQKQIGLDLIAEAVADLPYIHSELLPMRRVAPAPSISLKPPVTAFEVKRTAPPVASPIPASAVPTAAMPRPISQPVQAKAPVVELSGSAATVLSAATAPSSIPVVPEISVIPNTPKPILKSAPELVPVRVVAPVPAREVGTPSQPTKVAAKAPEKSAEERVKRPAVMSDPLPLTTGVYGKRVRVRRGRTLRNAILVFLVLTSCASAGYFVARYKSVMLSGEQVGDVKDAATPASAAQESLPNGQNSEQQAGSNNATLPTGSFDKIVQPADATGAGDLPTQIAAGVNTQPNTNLSNSTSAAEQISIRPSDSAPVQSDTLHSGGTANRHRANLISDSKGPVATGRFEANQPVKRDDKEAAPLPLVRGIRPEYPSIVRKTKFSQWDY
jgi:type II secretory pathway predicted ATPase ExeA